MEKTRRGAEPILANSRARFDYGPTWDQAPPAMVAAATGPNENAPPKPPSDGHQGPKAQSTQPSQQPPMQEFSRSGGGSAPWQAAWKDKTPHASEERGRSSKGKGKGKSAKGSTSWDTGGRGSRRSSYGQEAPPDPQSSNTIPGQWADGYDHNSCWTCYDKCLEFTHDWRECRDQRRANRQTQPGQSWQVAPGAPNDISSTPNR